MTDEEFERWKVDNGWYASAGDVIFFLALLILIEVAVWLS